MGKKAYMGPMQDPNGINAPILPIWVPYIHVCWGRDSFHILELFFFNRQRIQDEAAWVRILIRVFAVLIWRMDKGDKCSIKLNIDSVSFCCGNFHRQQSPDQAARICRPILMFAVIMWPRCCCHVSAHLFFQQTVSSRLGCADTQAHMGIRCSHVWCGQRLSFSVLFQRTDQAAQMRRLI